MKKQQLLVLILTLFLAFSLQTRAQFVNITDSIFGVPPGSVQGKESFAWTDYNNDGYVDLFINPKFLYKNNGDTTFTLIHPDSSGFSFLDPTNFLRATFADADNDGDRDAVLLAYYGDKDFYFENQGPPDYRFSGSVLFFHDPPNTVGGHPTFFDSDGDLDYEVYLGMMGNWDPMFEAEDHFLDLGDTSWQDVTYEKMAQMASSDYYRAVRGNIACDYDQDWDIDLFVPVYGIVASNNHNNMLWKNNGSGRFADVATSAGVGNHPTSNYGGLASGASWGDYNNDGWFDLAVANIHGKAVLYQNNGDGTFTDVSSTAGLPTSNGEWHNTLWIDYDNDGDLDLLLNKWYDNQFGAIYENLGQDNGFTFTNATQAAGFPQNADLEFVSGWAAADYDKDGDMDLTFYRHATGNRGILFYRNDFSNNNNWLVTNLIGDGNNINRDALGSQARIKLNDTAWSRVMQVEASSADQGQNMLPLHFGLGTHNDFDFIRIRWTNGVLEDFDFEYFGKSTNQWADIQYGEGIQFSLVIDSLYQSPIIINDSGFTLVQIDYALSGNFTQNNNFSVHLSDKFGNWWEPINTASFQTDQTTGAVDILIPNEIPPGEQYYLRIVSTSPEIIGQEFGPIVIEQSNSINDLSEDIPFSYVVKGNDLMLSFNPDFNVASAKIEVFDLAGRQIKSNSPSFSELSIHFDQSGLFLLKVTDADNNRQWIKKILIP